MTRESNQISGSQILRDVKAIYRSYRPTVESMRKNIAIIRFEAAVTDPLDWKYRMMASRISAEQKVKTFAYLGFQTEHVVLPPDVSNADFAALIDRFSADPTTSAVIVQFPPPARLRPLVQRLHPDKDIDALLERRAPYSACATAEGICRVVQPFTSDEPRIAVVGSRGFVGRGVVRLLKQQGLHPIELDLGDDLTRVRNADIVISVTGQPRLLGPEYIRAHHRLVVDSGFVPRPGGVIVGDVQREAYGIPQNITPVPGGIGPVEMAVLMERIVRKEIDHNLQPWSYQILPYRTHEENSTRAVGMDVEPTRESIDSRTAAQIAQEGFPGSIRDALGRSQQHESQPTGDRPPGIRRDSPERDL